jgi:cytochrome c553
MSLRSTVPALIATAAVACIAIPALTQESAGDADRGQKLSYTCYGCHGIENYKNVYPTYSVPKLQGQHPEYLVAALQGYRSGDRAHSTMHAQAASMSDQDMQDIAAFLAGNTLQPGAGTAAAPPKSVELCIACHGPDGVGITSMYPTIAGQHEDYIERSLLDYKNGARKNPVMAGFVAQLTDKDIAEIAAYYAKQRPSLSTAEHAIWFAAEK